MNKFDTEIDKITANNANISPATYKYPRGLTHHATYVQSKSGKIDLKDYVSYSPIIKGDKTEDIDLIITAISLNLSQDKIVHLLSGKTFKSVTIIAGCIDIKSSITLPGTPLRFYANTIICQEKAVISTAGKSYKTETRPSNSKPGKDGQDGGTIEIYLGNWFAGSGPAFCTNGGSGQKPGPGIAGVDGKIGMGGFFVQSMPDHDKQKEFDRNLKDSDVEKLDDWSRIPGDAIVGLVVDTYELSTQSGQRLAVRTKWTAEPYPTDASPPKAAGKPGSGGNAGNILCNLDGPEPERNNPVHLDELVTMKPGRSAEPETTPGGKAGFLMAASSVWEAHPNIPEILDTVLSWPREDQEKYKGKAYSKSGVNGLTMIGHSKAEWTEWKLHTWKSSKAIVGPNPDRKEGRPGIIEKVDRPEGWLHELHIPIYKSLIRDAYLLGDSDALQIHLNHIYGALKDWKDKGGKSSDANTELALNSGLLFFGSLRGRLVSGLDYFGNPAGWAPSLALGTITDLYKGSVAHSLKLLYATRWIQNVEANIDNVISGSIGAISSIQNRRLEQVKKFDNLSSLTGSLLSNIKTVQSSLKELTDHLKKREEELYEEAKADVSLRHVLNIAGSLLSVIPVFQPELGLVGAGIKSGSKYLDDKDPDFGNGLSDVLSAAAALGKSKAGEKGDDLKKKADNLKAEAKKAGKEKFKKKSEAKTAFEESRDGKVKELKKQAKEQSDKAKRYQHVTDNIGPAADKIISDIKGLCEPGPEVEARLAVLESRDGEFKQLAAKIRALNTMKTRLAFQLISTISMMAGLSADVLQGHLDEQNFYAAMTAADRANPGHGFKVAVDQLQTAAIDDLVRKQYYLIKSYENLFLQPYPGNVLNIEDFIKKFDKVANWPVEVGREEKKKKKKEEEKRKKIAISHIDLICDDQQWEFSNKDSQNTLLDKLAPILDEQADLVFADLIEKAINGGRDNSVKTVTPLLLELNADQLKSLNGMSESHSLRGAKELEQVCVDIAEHTDFHFDHNMSVITGMKIREIAFTQPDNDASATKSIDILHFGSGILKGSDGLYATSARSEGTAFDLNGIGDNEQSISSWHYTHPRAVQDWGFTCKSKQNDIEPDAPDGQTEYLFTKAVEAGGKTFDVKQVKDVQDLFTKLPAWTEIAIKKATSNVSWLVTKLVIEIEVAKVPATATTAVYIREQNGLSGGITLIESNGHQRVRTTPCFEIVEADSELTILPGYFGNKTVSNITRKTGETLFHDNVTKTWKTTVNQGQIENLKIELSPAEFGPPLQPLVFLRWSITKMDFFNQYGFDPESIGGWTKNKLFSFAVSFVTTDSVETALGPWSEEVAIGDFVFPVMGNIPVDPTGTSTERKIYIRFRLKDETKYSKPKFVKTIYGNTFVQEFIWNGL